ncbi:fatty acid--CoA ligase [Nevskia sp.]|uniref:fatty acid--CoA ligase n=1 Tax=Nevskia sp. TaxID=1929292 RepID=UPI0025D86A8D|nr:fatty acid--CoA ligase [Nevskia sp.]
MNSFNNIERTTSAYDYQLLIKHLLTSPIARASKHEIVYRDQARFTYPQFVARVNRLANVLTALGAKPGQTIAVMEWDSHRYLELYFAIPMLGCVMQTVNIRLSPDQILYTLNHAAADMVLVATDFVPVLESLHDKLETAKTFVLISDDGSKPASKLPFVGEYESLLAQAGDHFTFPEFDENTRMSTFYTSGTTGLPKGVYYSHRQMMLHTLAVASTFGTAGVQGRIHQDDVYMAITPMFHVHAWGMPYVATLLGIKQVYAGRYTPDMLLQLLAKENVTYSHCVPTILHMILSHPAAKGVDLSRWKVLIGGSALPKGLAKAALDRGIDVFTGYGMSETGPLQVINHIPTDQLGGDSDHQASLRVRTGRPALLCDVRTIDDQVNVLPNDGKAVGEIVFRSVWTTQGYYKNPNASEELWKGGWMHSGDIGTFGDDGVLVISDRVKDVIKTGGEWVSSLDLENLISAHPTVSEVAVIGIKDPKWGERPVALIVLKPDATGDEAEIKRYMMTFADKGVISKYGVPERVLFVEALDKTSVGKLDKKVLRVKYAEAGAA